MVSKMKSMWAGVKRAAAAVLLAGALTLGVAGMPARADAADRIVLKDGRIVEGQIVREQDGVVWIKTTTGGLTETKFFTPSEIKSVEREGAGGGTPGTTPKPEAAAPVAAGTPGAAAGAPGVTATGDTPSKKRPGVTRAAVLTLGEGGEKDMVGLYMTAKALKDAIPALERDEVDVVVFRVNSGGGALLEIQRLSDVIHNEYKKRFRCVAWIEWAISAAAMTSHCLEEIYMTPQGAYGGCTGWSGDLKAVDGRALLQILYDMEKITARGNHDPKIMASMQIMRPLSATIDSNGKVTYYDDTTSGEILLNPEGRILTFNSQTAAKVKFSGGTARTLKDLEKLMGLTEVEWVGRKVPGIEWPVSRAEQIQMDFRSKTFEDTERVQEYFYKYQAAVAAARAVPPERRGRFIGRARQALLEIKRMIDNNPNLALFQLNMLPDDFKKWYEEREKELRELAK